MAGWLVGLSVVISQSIEFCSFARPRLSSLWHFGTNQEVVYLEAKTIEERSAAASGAAVPAARPTRRRSVSIASDI